MAIVEVFSRIQEATSITYALSYNKGEQMAFLWSEYMNGWRVRCKDSDGSVRTLAQCRTQRAAESALVRRVALCCSDEIRAERSARFIDNTPAGQMARAI